ncbi:MAG TPA: O-antigen ligase family protein [Thermoanaerobaculia bacterium]|jgi:O-antigen ligase|nr:O-antigen ligase family protein [Thermoanaerobaculia bacterium]
MVDFETIAAPIAPEASGAEKLALRVMQVGAIAVVMVVSTLHVFELDRFFVPKELAFHLTAVVAGLLVVRAMSRLDVTRVEVFLAGYVLLSALSALMAANRWLALRALAISTSSIVLFRVARALRNAGLARAVIHGLGLAVMLVAVMSLLQTYGVRMDLFSENRAPGGTLGNRNFVAHVAAFGLPLLLFSAMAARSRRAYGWRAIGAALVLVALVLTRSRAAWLAFAITALVVFAAMLFSKVLRRDARTWKRLAGIALIAAAGIGAALVLPNSLHWNDDNPYLESLRRVTDAQEGSGHGRLIQYGRSLLLAARHPLFGVGPGNWPVTYPAHAAKNDPSLDQGDMGMTSNPWPSSDWMAFLTERGLAAFLLLLFAVLKIARDGLRQLRRARDAEEGIAAVVLLATLAGACVAGAFDAVLLLAVPAFLMWAALGSLWIPDEAPSRPAWRYAFAAMIVISAIGVYRSAKQLIAMNLFSAGGRVSITRAAEMDPGSYRIQMRLARMGGRARCEHARAAHELFPTARAAAQVARGCGK